MNDVATRLIARLQAAERQELLMLLAATITEITILGRSHYDGEDAAGPLRQSNEAIHRIAVHLRDLCDPAEVFTDSRSAAIGAQLGLLHPSAVARIFGFTA